MDNWLYGFAILFVSYKLIKWIYSYLYKIAVINKIDGPYMLPLIGNLHQVKQGPGIFFENKYEI